MKYLIILLASLICTIGLVVPSAQAAYGAYAPQQNKKIVGYDPQCGCPIWAVLVLVGYDYYGRPIWQWRILPVVHTCGRRF